jgi:ribose 1,5-bisphosphokinase PhnN
LFPSFLRNAKAAVPELLSNELEGKGAEKQDEINKKIIKQRSSTANVCY